jgi:peptidoglycan-N-acetylglucosamine deacetylase
VSDENASPGSREDLADRRARRAAAADRRRARLRRTIAVGAVLAVLLVAGAAAGVVWLARRGSGAAGAGSGSSATAPTAPPAATATRSVDASGTVTPTGTVAATGTVVPPPAGTPKAVTQYAEPYPGAGAVTPVVLRRVNVKRKLVAITLDDGIPFDTRMLTLFEQNGIRCTTFVLGQFAHSRPDLMKRLKKDGFEIANHTYDHKTLTKMSASGIRTELSKTQAAISKITGNQAPYMRPPGGAFNSTVKSVSASMGFRVVMWSRSLADTSKSATPLQCYKNAVNNLQPGEIILCHWGRPATYEAMKLILPELRRRGFEVVTVSELVADAGGVKALK